MLIALPFGMQLLTAALMAIELMLYFSLHFGYVQRFARRSVRLIAPIAPPAPGSLDGFEITPMGPGRWLIRRAHGLTRRLPFFALLTCSPGPLRLQYGVGPVSLYAFPALVIPAFGTIEISSARHTRPT